MSHGSRGRRPRGLLAGAALAIGATALVACGNSAGGASSPTDAPSSSPVPAPSANVVADYLPGRGAQLRTPDGEGPAPLIVMVPGGGWATADPSGLVPLAEDLTQAGSTTSLITYRTTDTASTFPDAVDDVACAIRWSAQQAASAGHPPTHVIALGHSAGGHLASLVAFSGDEFGAECPYPPVTVDGLIGLAGVYDTDAIRHALAGWVGVDPAVAPETWRRVNPVAWLGGDAAAATGLRVLLLHGDGDTSVPVAQTTTLADALSSAGIDVSTAVLPGLGHLEIFETRNAFPPIRAWMDEWPPA